MAVALDASVGKYSGQSKEFFIGLATVVVVFAIYFLGLFLLQNKTKYSYKVNPWLAGLFTALCLGVVCGIAILVEDII